MLSDVLMFDHRYIITWASFVAQLVKNLPAKQETWVPSLGEDDPLEKGMATHSSILAGESHGQRSLAGCSPWGHKDSDTTEQLTHRPSQETPLPETSCSALALLPCVFCARTSHRKLKDTRALSSHRRCGFSGRASLNRPGPPGRSRPWSAQ